MLFTGTPNKTVHPAPPAPVTVDVSEQRTDYYIYTDRAGPYPRESFRPIRFSMTWVTAEKYSLPQPPSTASS